MNRYLLLLVSMLIAFSVKAEYAYMKFTTTAGDTHYVSTGNLTITVEGENLVATNDYNETLTLGLTSVASMELVGYMATAETIATESNGEVEVFMSNGVSAGRYMSIDDVRKTLSPGIYLVKNNSGQTIKLMIGK